MTMQKNLPSDAYTVLDRLESVSGCCAITYTILSLAKDLTSISGCCATTYMILAWLKSISGCCAMNFLSSSCFFCSSEEGSPICFCRWSYIIFSTVTRVSLSRSVSFEFSGSTCAMMQGFRA